MWPPESRVLPGLAVLLAVETSPQITVLCVLDMRPPALSVFGNPVVSKTQLNHRAAK